MKRSELIEQRRSGVLLHPTSLPGAYGCGDLGPEAYAFVDQLKAARQRWWQMLPMVPIGMGNSPYQSESAFAGNGLLISLELLAKDKLLTAQELSAARIPGSGSVPYKQVIAKRTHALEKAFVRFNQSRSKALKHAFESFVHNESSWLKDYCLYEVLKQLHFNKPWVRWKEPYRKRDPIALARIVEQHAERMRFYQFVQFLFFKQWRALKEYATKQGIGLIGDVPIFIAHDSADVWAHQRLFFLDREGWPSVVAGVPPDYFSATGQHWGNPLYRWPRMRMEGYRWWIARLDHVLKRFDAVRLDHFIGFLRYWAIPAQALDARAGRYMRGPGLHFFKAVERALGKVPLIAEDLGVVTPEVTRLREACGLPGMRVLQFSFDPHPQAMQGRPFTIEKNCVVYTGTHDNDTVRGWFDALPKRSRTRRLVLDYMGAEDTKQVHWSFIKQAMSAPAVISVIPMQDILGLPSSARMNFPGTLSGNWNWRMRPGAFSKRLVKKLAEQTELYGRAA